MKMTILKSFVETGIARAPHAFSPGEEVDVPKEIAARWQRAGLAEPITECATVAAPETAMRKAPKPRTATRR